MIFFFLLGANVHATTATGDTALTYACENGHTDVADVLLQAGADLVRYFKYFCINVNIFITDNTSVDVISLHILYKITLESLALCLSCILLNIFENT